MRECGQNRRGNAGIAVNSPGDVRAQRELVATDGWMEGLMGFDGRRARAELHLDDEYGHRDAGFVVKGPVTHPEEPTGGSPSHDHGSTWVVRTESQHLDRVLLGEPSGRSLTRVCDTQR